MKNLFIAMALMAFVLSSCGSKENKSHNETHTHTDGTVHEGHEHEQPDQEAFEVKTESNKCCSGDKKEGTEACDSTVHDHAHNHSHE